MQPMTGACCGAQLADKAKDAVSGGGGPVRGFLTTMLSGAVYDMRLLAALHA